MNKYKISKMKKFIRKYISTTKITFNIFLFRVIFFSHLKINIEKACFCWMILPMLVYVVMRSWINLCCCWYYKVHLVYVSICLWRCELSENICWWKFDICWVETTWTMKMLRINRLPKQQKSKRKKNHKFDKTFPWSILLKV